MESLSQVAVDLGDRQIAGVPRQAFSQDLELLGVAGAGPGPHGVVKREVVKSHWAKALAGEDSSQKKWVDSTPPDMPYNRNMFRGTPSSIVYSTLQSALAWVFLRDHPILRLAYFAALTLFLWLNRLGDVCTLLVLGQLGEAIKEVSRGRNP